MRKTIITACLIFCCSSTALSSGFSIYEASVRANGMLGAFAAYANHVSTIFYNPAGLAALDGLQISGGVSIIAPRTSFRNTTPLAPYGKKYETIEQSFLVPNFYASYQITDRLTAGIGIYSPFGLGTKWPRNWVGRGAAIKTSIKTVFVNPAIGYKLPDFGIGTIRVGVGLRIVAYGKVELSRAVTSFTPEGFFRMEGELADPAFGYNFGIQYQPIEELTFGFTYRSSIKTKYVGTAHFKNLPVGFPKSEVSGSTIIELPASWVAAVNVEVTPSLTVEADYVWFGWSSYDKLVINFDQPIVALGGSTIASKRNFQDSWQIRVGAEYENFGVEGLTLRAGIAFDKNPIPEQFVDPTLPDTDRWEFSGGLTYAINEHIAIDAAYIFIQGQQRRVQNTISGINGVYNTHAHIPSIGFTLTY